LFGGGAEGYIDSPLMNTAQSEAELAAHPT
jgi:hypothetical protein